MSSESGPTGSADDAADPNVVQRAAQRAMRNPGTVYSWLFRLAVVAILLTTLFPFYWLTVVALTPLSRIRQIRSLDLFGVDLPIPVPAGLNLNAFFEVFQVVPFHRYMFNSIAIALLTTAIVLVVASFAGYAFGRLEFRGRRVLLVALLAVSYFPPVTFALPIFQLFTGNVVLFTIEGVVQVSSPNWFNTPGALVTPFSALFMPLAIFILTTFYGQIPDGLEDAARIEGTTRFGALFRVIVPLSAPGVATAGVLTFITVYNEFFFSFLLTDGQASSWAPIVSGILSYRGQYTEFYNLMAMASIIGVIPVALLVVVAQEKIVSGLTSGALKE
jgi:multiple sugar transport system permease protein